MNDSRQSIGIIGLGVMGKNIALNMASHGIFVVAFDSDPIKVKSFARLRRGASQYIDVFRPFTVKVQFAGALQSDRRRGWCGGKGVNRRATPPAGMDRRPNPEVIVVSRLRELVEGMQPPRRILMMVPAGSAVDKVIERLRPLLEPGDLLVDGGNSHFRDTDRRMLALRQAGIHYLGMGVSGGEEGARLGPCLMPGGDVEGWDLVKSEFYSIAAKAGDGAACCHWIGNGGAGHFVKMVHNGIEYADMQLIGEAYWLMKSLLHMGAEEIGEVFDTWNQGELESYLMEITSTILKEKDPLTGNPLVDMILDKAAQKGTGKWMGQEALELGSPAPTIAVSVFARHLSALKKERIQASSELFGPKPVQVEDRTGVIEGIGKALFCSKLCVYAQGFQFLRDAGREHGWDLHLGTIASLWRGGCILRARLLEEIREAFFRDPKLTHLLIDPCFSARLGAYNFQWREMISMATRSGVPVAAFMSSLSFYDSYRSARLPANLLQAQRDYFGAHTYERVDREGVFHNDWDNK